MCSNHRLKLTSRRYKNVIARSAIQINSAYCMTCIGSVLNNKLYNMNYKNRNTLRVLQLWGSACYQQFAVYLAAT